MPKGDRSTKRFRGECRCGHTVDLTIGGSHAQFAGADGQRIRCHACGRTVYCAWADGERRAHRPSWLVDRDHEAVVAFGDGAAVEDGGERVAVTDGGTEQATDGIEQLYGSYGYRGNGEWFILKDPSETGFDDLGSDILADSLHYSEVPKDVRERAYEAFDGDRVVVEPESTVQPETDREGDGLRTDGGDGTFVVIQEPTSGNPGKAGLGVRHRPDARPGERVTVEQLWPDGEAEPVYVREEDIRELIYELMGIGLETMDCGPEVRADGGVDVFEVGREVRDEPATTGATFTGDVHECPDVRREMVRKTRLQADERGTQMVGTLAFAFINSVVVAAFIPDAFPFPYLAILAVFMASFSVAVVYHNRSHSSGGSHE